MEQVEEVSRAASPSTGRVYGLARVCALWGIARSSFYWSRQPGQHRKPGPKGLHSDEVLVEQIRRVLQESPFTGEGYRKVWAQLRFRGFRTSPLRTLRIMREYALLAFQRPRKPHGPKAHDGTIKTMRVDEMW
ncbi:hypothetical protein C6366_15030 [Desulfonatronum sp. SC1]|nr:hypothetical protein C6366_15030 [Desulfonatronum sp. SC1]